ncbi:PaaI family thioesterase [Mycobacterium paragordonae]|uniref:Acyl-coenzyme A thioesterase THEM4 n=3 Tax=Mycobacteriaceae TaxID=1762 RepID=A0A386U730_9MYCO|nr:MULTISPECIES: PaaI family thioesterase [Mycobacteriaceae]OBK78436.1 thioesterase [Mycobacterium sp. 1164985.4]UVO14909.1 PaaI family thioesterase [Mycobacterium sp. SVM_VP21]AYE96384.1 PaaI family thioesterase [Mycobacterium paragordonae]MCQ4364893.1 PaaI family thioesterase [Mycobacterium gordonae]MCV7193731.1 PaaI family thioesterase [Mycolicibacterium brumae]
MAWWHNFQNRVIAADGDYLDAHHPWCLGCGTDNPHGHRLRARRRGDGVGARHIFDGRHRGAPGIAHGGAVMTVLDDTVGMLLYVVGEMAVTRKLDTEFFAPVLLGVPYEVSAELVSRTGRKLEVRTELREEATGQLVASASGLFVVVTLDHFTSSIQKASSIRCTARPPWEG